MSADEAQRSRIGNQAVPDVAAGDAPLVEFLECLDPTFDQFCLFVRESVPQIGEQHVGVAEAGDIFGEIRIRQQLAVVAEQAQHRHDPESTVGGFADQRGIGGAIEQDRVEAG